MVNRLPVILLFLVAWLMPSCTGSSLLPEEYVAYCNDEANGLIQKREFGTLLYSLKYEPVEYKTLQELLAGSSPVEKQAFDKLKKEYDSLYYFTFKIESPGSEKSPLKSLAKNKEDFAKLTMFCQTGLQQAFYVESQGRKIPCVLFHIEDDYSLVPYNMMSMAFEAKEIEPKQDFVFVFEDPLFKTGLIKFNISGKQTGQLPTLNFHR